MQMRRLGNTDINVSLICLGTMTWGEQNTEAEAHEQLNYAVDQGINFIDTAELYPVPPMAETQGRTEEYIGSWLKTQQRDKLILATKVVGPSDNFGDLSYLGRGMPTKLNKEHIHQAIDTSLQRLGTDYVDLYQLHWPQRRTNFFGVRDYQHQPEHDSTSLLETLEALDGLVKAGKVRHVGLSNETAWGMMECLRLGEKHDLPRMQSVQNPYNLLNRLYEIGAAECSIRSECGLLAYSPLAFGYLSGKYLNGQKPEGARLTKYERFARYTSNKAETATTRYVALAEQHGLTPTQLALAFVNQQPFVTSNIIGATTMEQLKENIGTEAITLSDEVMEAINVIHADDPNPCP
jgi:aryl-alcohol dehydrogenase-like predicted oxidoreductase